MRITDGVEYELSCCHQSLIVSSQNKSFNVVSLLFFKSKVLVASFERITVFGSCLQVAQSDEPNINDISVGLLLITGN